MSIDKRFMLVIALIISLGAVQYLAQAQTPSDFDPVAVAKLRVGEIARKISGSERDSSVPAPSDDLIFNTGLLLQAGLRALLPVKERQGVALPGTPSRNDSAQLVKAQENYKAVFESGIEPTPEQRIIAIQSIDLAAHQLERAGYRSLSQTVSDWVKTQRQTP